MKQRLERKKLTAFLGVLVILALFAGLVLFMMLMHVVADLLRLVDIDTVFLPYVEYVLLIVLGVVIVRRWMTEYAYELIDDELIIDRYIGRNPRNLLRLRLRQITDIRTQAPDGCSVQRLTFKPKKHGIVYIVYVDADKKRCAAISPSTDFLELLKKRSGLDDQRQ